jgi:hypothetical protein
MSGNAFGKLAVMPVKSITAAAAAARVCVNPGMDDLLVRDIARAQDRQLGWLAGDAILLRSPAVAWASSADSWQTSLPTQVGYTCIWASMRRFSFQMHLAA